MPHRGRKAARAAKAYDGSASVAVEYTTASDRWDDERYIEASCPCGATGDEQSIREHIESRVCPEGGTLR